MVVSACGGGGGGSESPSGGQILEVVQPTPPAASSDAVAARVPYVVRASDGHTTFGRDGQPATQIAAPSGTVSSQSLIGNLLDFLWPDEIFDAIFGNGSDSGPNIHDYFPTGADDSWTFLGAAEILQGADPVFLLGVNGTPANGAPFAFTLVAAGNGFSFSDQSVADGTITATPALLWIPNDLHVGATHSAEGDLDYTPDPGSTAPEQHIHVVRTITLVGKGPHITTHSSFADVLHFRTVDRLTHSDATTDTLTYDLFLARGFGPVECRVTRGDEARSTEVERAIIDGRALPDTDGDGLVDAEDSDDDNDGVLDDGDGSGVLGDTPCTTTVAGCDDAFPKDAAEQADADGDGLGNNADLDDDGDGILDNADNCPTLANPAQADRDLDGLGDHCDPCPRDAANDADHDGVCGDIDNCPLTANPNQTDSGADGIGDACPPAVTDLRVTSVTDSSVTLSWLTLSEGRPAVTAGEVRYHPVGAAGDQSATDVRGSTFAGTTHYVRLTRLLPTSDYVYVVTLDGGDASSGGFTTAASLNPLAGEIDLDPLKVKGRVTTAGQPAAGALVYLRFSNADPDGGVATPLAALTGADGAFLLQSNFARTPTGGGWFAASVAGANAIHLEVASESGRLTSDVDDGARVRLLLDLGIQSLP